jgi:hypothetical protein
VIFDIQTAHNPELNTISLGYLSYYKFKVAVQQMRNNASLMNSLNNSAFFLSLPYVFKVKKDMALMKRVASLL